ncbi:MAG: Smr/MutS family protein, partial [Bacillota bacterium]|nr:Smr/MutS family protein [Bacillota bacterium]
TVTLKTVGLLHLMAQSGLFIPAATESEVSVFDEILADIGDEQSIAQNLSTFSAHLSNIVRLFGLIRGQSLVLLDELGTGTDPAEGAALAIAILEELRGRAKAIVTTHFSELKTYAHNAPRVENAAVEFDAVSLRPTYRLLIGLPGRSNALEIAARLGLQPEVIERARRLLPGARVELEELLRHLEEERRSAEEARREVERQRDEARRWAEEYRDRSARLREERSRIVTEARARAEQLLKEARAEIDALVGELRRLVAQPPATREEVEAAAAAVRGGLADLERRLAHRWAEEGAKEEPGVGSEGREGFGGPAPGPAAPLEPGMRVWVATLDQEGTVIAPAAGGAAVEVQLGPLRATVPLGSVRPLPPERRLPPEGARRSNVEQLARAKAASISPELHVRRLPVAEALERTGKYLDDALLAGLTRVRIVHGKGTGALREAVRAYLEQHPRVVRFQSAPYSEGGDGVTVVELE